MINDGEGSGEDMFSSRSIKYMEVYIYTRNGDKVYQYKGDDDNWEGWDGKRYGRPVKAGVYFWVIMAQGYDGKEHVEKGYVHVYP
jgi:hypothetical protein